MSDRHARAGELFLRSFVYRSGLSAIEQACESPIERAMFWNLASEALERGWGIKAARGTGQPMEVGSSTLTIATDERVLLLAVQVAVAGYRVDLLLRPQGGPSVVVECDGHAFHERTKEQAARDRRRDRVLQAAGLPVLRFTGSEIHKEPFVCARQVLEFIEGTLEGGEQ